jgi:hypothetical protein
VERESPKGNRIPRYDNIPDAGQETRGTSLVKEDASVLCVASQACIDGELGGEEFRICGNSEVHRSATASSGSLQPGRRASVDQLYRAD